MPAALRSKIGNTLMTNILTPQRADLMREITQDLTRQAAAPYGIRIVDIAAAESRLAGVERRG